MKLPCRWQQRLLSSKLDVVKRLLVGLVLLFISFSLYAVPVIDSVSSINANQPSSLTVSHTVAGTDRFMLVGVSFQNSEDETVRSITYGGVNLTRIGFHYREDDSRVELWGLVAPVVGRADVVARFYNPYYSDNLVWRDAGLGVMTFTGVHQLTPYGTMYTSDGESTNASLSLPSDLDDLAVGVIAAERQIGGTIITGSGLTEHWSFRTQGGDTAGAGASRPGAPSAAFNWRLPYLDDWAAAGIAIKPSVVSNGSCNGIDYSQYTSIFSDDFSDGDFSGWSVNKLNDRYSCSWSVASGRLREQSDSCRASLEHDLTADGIDPNTTTDYVLKVDIDPNGVATYNDGVGFVFGYEDDLNYYIVRWWNYSTSYSSNSQHRKFELGRYQNGSYTSLAQRSRLDLPSTFTLTVVADGDSGIDVFVDCDTSSYNLSYAGTAPPVRLFGLYTHDNDSGVFYDNVEVFIKNDPELVAEWRLDGPSWNGSSNEIIDSSPNALHGHIVGRPTPQAAQVCRGAALNGTDQYIEIADNPLLNISDELTVTAWIDPDALPASDVKTILSNDINYEFHINSVGEVIWWWGTGSVTSSGANITAAGGWYHVAIVYSQSAGTQKIYVNGVERASGTATGALPAYNGPLQIGEDHGFGDREFDGLIDEVRVYHGALSNGQVLTVMNETHPCTNPSDHIEISHDGSGINCQPEPITFNVHNASHDVDAAYTGTINLSTSTGHGDWSVITGEASSLSNTGNGVGRYTFTGSESGSVVLGLYDTYVETVNINVTDGTITESSGSATGSEDTNVVYSAAGFQFLANNSANAIGTQIAGKSSGQGVGAQTLELQAVQTNTSTGVCEAILTGNQTVQMAFECENPGSCLRPAYINGTRVNGSATSGSLNYSNVNLDFGNVADDTAEFSFNYPDVGRAQLHARLALSPSNEYLSGSSNSFVVRPFGFDVSVTGNPGAASSSGSVFREAGLPFETEVSAALWNSSDDQTTHYDDLPGNNANLGNNNVTLGGTIYQGAPNFGREGEGIQLSSTLNQPSSGRDPGLAGSVNITTFSDGSGSTSSTSFDEVGIIEIGAEIRDGDYLGIGSIVTDLMRSKSGFVGRFFPDHFSVSSLSLTNRTSAACSPASSFTYMDEGFGVGYTLTAESAVGTTTENYETGTLFAKLSSTSSMGYGAVDTATSTDRTSRITQVAASASWTSGVTNISDTLLIDRFTNADGPFDSFAVGVAPSDSDGVTLLSSDMNLDVDLDTSNDHIRIGSTRIRYGRVRLQNAHGSELNRLPMPMQVEYYAGSRGFITHSGDSCSNSFSLGITDVDVSDGLDPVETSLSFSQPPSSGVFDLSLAAPGANNTGVVQVTVDTLPNYLTFDWNGDGSIDGSDDPSARATFGVYSQPNTPVIYLREMR